MEPKYLFNENVPEKFQRAMLSMVFDACANASEHCYGTFNSSSVAGTWQRLSAWTDRGSMAGHAVAVPSFVDQSFSVQAQHWYLLRDHFGACKAHAICIYHPDEVPREAEFRKTLATNGQRVFSFEEQTLPEVDPASFLYAVLTYGIASQDKESALVYIRVQFLNENCTAYVDKGIDLVSEVSRHRFEVRSKRRLQRRR